MMKRFISAVISSVFVIAVQAQSVKEAVRLMEVEKFGKAKVMLTGLYKKNPAAEYAFYLGELYYQTEVPDSAKFFYEAGIKHDPAYALNYAGMGKVVYPSNSAEGKKYFEKALEVSKSKNSQIHTTIAAFYIENDKLDVPEAMTLLDAAAKIDPKNPEIPLLKGDGYWKIADPSKGVLQYEQALKLDPKYSKAYLRLGYSYYRVYNYDRALEYLKDGLNRDSTYAPFHREMGDVYYKQEKFDQAFLSYKKYVSMADQDENTTIRYASFLILAREFKKAYEVLKPYEGKDKTNASILRLLSYTYYELGEYDKGLECMNKFRGQADVKKFLASDYEYYGKLLAKKDQDSLAAENIKTAFAMDSSRYDLLGELGSIYMSMKKYDRASEVLEKKIAKKSTTIDLYNLGRAYYYSKDYVKADTTFGLLIEAVPDYANGYIWKARAKSNLDPTSEKGLAKPYFEKFLSLTSGEEDKYKRDRVSSYEYLGYYFLLKKENAKAKEVYTKLKELDPSNKKAEDGLKIISGGK